MFSHPSALQHTLPGDPTPEALHREEYYNEKTEATEDELTYAGDYLLSVFDGETGEVFTLTGKVTCGGE